ncbi:SH3 domain-binding protein 5-like [Palaemon carinicauda]|uniref:SH3 domain-binding protein 5-like n=1 Tax=Palaemon carinicauda TaxID=392227 RepID=UPI0035B5FAEF
MVEANHVFRTTLTESTARLKALAKKLGSCIEKARPFYEAQELARKSQLDCQRAAVQYQRANALHQAAKETIALAEERFVNSRHERWQFDSAWQEMLNHATMKVMEAEAQKAASEREHMRRAGAFTQAEQKVQHLQRGLRSSINKSLVYFEEKANITAQLEGQKERVQQLQRAIAASKSAYAQSLRSLELISEEIHEQRRCRLPREPGVGAELTPPEISDDPVFSPKSAKSFTPLEEMTAKEEKYWETLRQKLEKLQVKSENCSTEEEVFSDLESPDGRERTVTGSSCVSNSAVELIIEEERVVSGESSQGSESDGAHSPTERQNIILAVNTNLNIPKLDNKNSSTTIVEDDGTDIEDIEITLEEDNGETLAIWEVTSKKEGDSENKKVDNVPISTLRTNVCTMVKNTLDNVDTDMNKNRNALMSNSSHKSDESEAYDSDKSSDADDNCNQVKEMGDGSSSPPPAMCQPSRSLSVIPE